VALTRKFSPNDDDDDFGYEDETIDRELESRQYDEDEDSDELSEEPQAPVRGRSESPVSSKRVEERRTTDTELTGEKPTLNKEAQRLPGTGEAVPPPPAPAPARQGPPKSSELKEKPPTKRMSSVAKTSGRAKGSARPTRSFPNMTAKKGIPVSTKRTATTARSASKKKSAPGRKAPAKKVEGKKVAVKKAAKKVAVKSAVKKTSAPVKKRPVKKTVARKAVKRR